MADPRPRLPPPLTRKRPRAREKASVAPPVAATDPAPPNIADVFELDEDEPQLESESIETIVPGDAEGPPPAPLGQPPKLSSRPSSPASGASSKPTAPPPAELDDIPADESTSEASSSDLENPACSVPRQFREADSGERASAEFSTDLEVTQRFRIDQLEVGAPQSRPSSPPTTTSTVSDLRDDFRAKLTTDSGRRKAAIIAGASVCAMLLIGMTVAVGNSERTRTEAEAEAEAEADADSTPAAIEREFAAQGAEPDPTLMAGIQAEAVDGVLELEEPAQGVKPLVHDAEPAAMVPAARVAGRDAQAQRAEIQPPKGAQPRPADTAHNEHEHEHEFVAPDPDDRAAAEIDARIRAAIDKFELRAVDNILLVRKSSRTVKNYMRAEQHCNKFATAGLNDWRIPTIAELTMLSEARLIGRRRYWSNVEGDPNSRRMLILDAKRGRISSVGRRASRIRAICVRRR